MKKKMIKQNKYIDDYIDGNCNIHLAKQKNTGSFFYMMKGKEPI
jgi:hypothetical protein